MFYVYVIRSISTKYLYVGYTSNVQKRLESHNAGKVAATRKHKPFCLVYYEAYSDRKEAMARELKLKNYGSAFGHLKKRIKNSIDSI